MGLNNSSLSDTIDDVKYSALYDETLCGLRNNGTKEEVESWETKLCKRIKSPNERWKVLTYALRKFEGWGRYRYMLNMTVKQIEAAHEAKEQGKLNVRKTVENTLLSNILLARSFADLARANYWLSEFKKCIEYSTKSLDYIGKCRGENIQQTSKLGGEVHLCRGVAHLNMGNFRAALEDIEKSLSIAHSQNLQSLECMACCELGRLYIDLMDYEKASFFPLKAVELMGNSGSPRLRTKIQLHVAEAYRKTGKLQEAMECSEEAMKMAIDNDDRGLQAQCILCFADIHRVKKNPERALPRYDNAAMLMTEIGDRYGEVRVFTGRAKCLVKLKEYHKALKLYEEGLKSAINIGAKMLELQINGELAVLHQRMDNHKIAREITVKYHQLLDELQLFCGACANPIGETQEQLEALPCSHVFHLKCVSNLGLLNTRACPNCRKQSSKPTLPSSIASTTLTNK